MTCGIHLKRFLCSSLAIYFCICVQSALATDTFELARSGNTPGNINGEFTNFGAPSINSLGTVVFKGVLTDTSAGDENDTGIYRTGVPGGIGPFILTLEEVAREGSTYTAGGIDYILDDLLLTGFRLEDAPAPTSPVTGLFGKLALRLPVRSGNPDGSTILTVESTPVTTSGATVNLIASAGEEVPSGNGTFREFSSSGPADVSPAGTATFFSAMNNTDNGVDDNVALFRYRADVSLTEIVREGEPANGGAFFLLSTPRPNDLGDLIFLGSNDSGDPATNSGIYRVTANGTSAQYVLGEGDTAPSDDLDPRIFRLLSEIRLNNNGLIAFTGVMRAENGFSIPNDSGLYTIDGTSVTEIVREGQFTPDDTAIFRNFASTTTGGTPRPALNDLGQVAFAIDLDIPGSSIRSSGVFRASDDELIEIAREDDNYEDGTLFNFADPALNNDGLVAFYANLNVGTENGPEGPFVISEDILIISDGEDYATVAREGQEIGGRTIQDIFFNSVTTGIENGLSDSGIVAYSVRYTDGTRAVNAWRPQLGWRSAAGDGIWDDEANWFFNMAPNFASDVQIDSDTDVVLQGPSADTEVNSLSFGNGAGNVSFVAGLGSIVTSEGINIGENGTLQIGEDGDFLIGGSVNSNGVVELGDNSVLTIQGAFSGTGPINGAGGTTVFDGQLAPGNSPGLLIIEGDAILSENNETILEIAGLARGTEFDGVDVHGTLTLDGTLSIVLLDGFTFEVGDTFLLLQAGNLLGAFDTVNLPEIAGLQLLLDITGNSLSLSVQAVPVPSALWLFLSALLVLRKKQRAA